MGIDKPRMKHFYFPSNSNPDKTYTTILYTDGTTSCDCRGWIHSGAVRGCRHTKEVERDNPVTLPTASPVVAEAEEIMARAKGTDKPKAKPKSVPKKEEKKEPIDLFSGNNGFRDIEPMCAGVLKGPALDKVWDDLKWVAEEKLDGARYVLHLLNGKNRLFSRRKSTVDNKRIERTDNVPHLRDLEHELAGTILDGEIVVGPNCKSNDVTRVMGSHPDRAVEVQEKIGFVQYKVFDILQYKGKDVCDEPYSVRRALLEDVLKDLDWEEYISSPKRTTTGKREFCEEIIKAGGEGVILKDPDGKYVEGARPTCWAKVKRENNWNVICTGFTKGKNSFADTFGAIQFSMYVKGVLTEVGQCSGMTLQIRNEVHADRDSYMGKVFEVMGQEITDGGRIRHPRFKGWRLDVDPKTCTVESEAKSI